MAECPEGVASGWILDRYGAGLGHLIRVGKYRPDRRLVRVVGGRLADALGDRFEGAVTAVVPAPSTAWTRWRRGFSVAAVLAGPLSRRLGVPVVHALAVGPGPRQASLGPRARRRNLVGRIRQRRPLAGTVLLVDDVVTTGATLSACAVAALQAGAERVVAACACLGGGDPQTPVQNP